MAEWLTLDEQLLVLAARVHLDAEEAGRMLCLLQEKIIDWEAVGKLSERLDLAPLLYKHMSREDLTRFIPGEIFQAWKEEYRRNKLRNFSIYGQLDQILARKELAGIPLVPLKGVFLAKWIYCDIGLRPMSDIDLLCREQDFERIRSCLLSFGFSERRDKSVLHEKAVAHISHPPCFKHPARAKIDLHTQIFPFMPSLQKSPSLNNLWGETTPTELEGRPIRCLCPEDMLLHLTMHFCRHYETGPVRFIWLCDIHEVIGRYGRNIRWEVFVARMNALQVGEKTISLFRLLLEQWNSRVPQQVAFDSRRSKPRYSLTELITDGARYRKTTRKRHNSYVQQAKAITRDLGMKGLVVYLARTIFPHRKYLQYRFPGRPVFLLYPSYHFEFGKNASLYFIYNLKHIVLKVMKKDARWGL